MSSLSGRERHRAPNTSAYVSEIGIVGGTSSLAAVRARQMARQREINSAHSPTSRRLRTDDYLKSLYQDEEKEEKERQRAKAALREEQKLEQLVARADRVRIRDDDLPALLEKTYPSVDLPSQSGEVPYAVRRQKRLAQQSRRKSDERREQFSNDLARARALLNEERKKDDLEIAKDIKKGYGSFKPKRSGLDDDSGYRRGEPATTSILKTTNRRRFDLEDDYQPLGRTRLGDDRFSDLSLGRSNGPSRELGSMSRPATSRALSSEVGSRPSKEVHWSVNDF